ncbi:hypothetical protein [uncultured Sphingomonas sp.]|uniref:hypothetical protein n=1 Tax=uncultured Sphingomonas sp. TaxID=158754 RepID=UPI0035CC2D74
MPDAHRNGSTHGDQRRSDPTPPSPIERARGAASDTARRTVEGIESNPLGILVGGLAVGALAGALIPRSAKEKELLAPVGKRIGESARAAAKAAREAGQSELESRGLTADAGRDQVKTLLGGFAKALSTAGAAGAKAATDTATDRS